VWTGIAIFYLGCLLFGFLFALLGAIGGSFGSHGGIGEHGVEPGHGGEIGHESGGAHAGVENAFDVYGPDNMPGASIFNTITVSTFAGFLGIAGLISVWGFRMSPLTSLAFSLPTAAVIAVGQFLLYVKLLVKAQASSEATDFDLIGHEAEVITSIPEGGFGEIAYVIRGTRYTAPAKSEDGTAIDHGHQVVVITVEKTHVVVTIFE